MKILVLGGKSDSTDAVVNSLRTKYSSVYVILENDEPTLKLIKRRMKRLGLMTVIGQLIFMVSVPKLLRRKSKERIREIIEEYNLDLSRDYRENKRTILVNSVNDDRVKRIIQKCNPDIIVVNGTRIISADILSCTDAPFINMHVGITPKYRGVHGGYWAMVNNDPEHCGVTIHKVDEGIDTGEVIRQECIQTIKEDNYVTYPLIQIGVGIRHELEVLDIYDKTGKIDAFKPDLPSKMWSHPTIVQYLMNRGKSK